MTGNREFEHLGPLIPGRNRVRRFVRRAPRGNKPHLVQAALFATTLGENQVPEVNRIECAAQQAKSHAEVSRIAEVLASQGGAPAYPNRVLLTLGEGTARIRPVSASVGDAIGLDGQLVARRIFGHHVAVNKSSQKQLFDAAALAAQAPALGNRAPGGPARSCGWSSTGPSIRSSIISFLTNFAA